MSRYSFPVANKLAASWRQVSVSLKLSLIRAPHYMYVAAKATYIRLLHSKIGILGGFSALPP